MSAERAIYLASAVWGASWLAAAFWADRATARPGLRAEALYRVLTFVGACMVYGFASARGTPGWQAASLSHVGPFARPIWTIPAPLGWVLFAAALGGFLFCWWARLHLGSLWSSNVTRKAEHRIVDTGPYRLVRHPIYTGLLLSTLALAVDKGTPVALAGYAVLWFGLWTKARLEERFLRAELGAAAYDAYSRRTPMLVPGWPRWGRAH